MPASAREPQHAPRVLVVGGERGLPERLARALGGLADVVSDLGATEREPVVVVLDAEAPDALSEITDLRRRHPSLVIAAHLSRPQRSLWEAAERAGADLVTNTGALGRALRRLLAGLSDQGLRRRRIPLFDAAEVAGRLGMVCAVDETPVGPVAVYRYRNGLACAADICPHAGARLSEGHYDGDVVTCPAHGSQFDVATGERLRGPSDQHLATYTVSEEDGRIWLYWA